MGHRLDEASERLVALRKKGWPSVVKRARADDQEWLGRTTVPGLDSLSEAVQNLFWRSLFLLRTQADHRGAIIAATDSDILETNRATYSYCWPRDGAMVCRTLSRLGYTEYAERFVRFCERVKSHDQPFLMQKYRGDGSLGASWHPWVFNGKPEIPFQEDETALTLLALESCALDERALLWDSFGRSAAQFLVDHRSGDGLPLPSFDLWEERRGVHFFTVCAIVAALEACERMDSSGRFREVADEMVAAAEIAFVDAATGHYVRMVQEGELDTTSDSAVLGGLLLVDPGRFARESESVEAVERSLTVRSKTGGLARYDKDYYFRKSERFPGNPWVIATMWSARMRLRSGDADSAVELLEWAAERAEVSGVLAEQYHPETGDPLSVSPLTWSHAEFVETVLHVIGHSQLGAR
jgi:GH15 family glucan-1,4-alpha-glucosidase